MKKLFFAGFLVFFCCFLNIANAQTTEAFRRELQVPDSVLRTVATVVEHGEAASAVRTMQAPAGDNVRVDVIRVLIFSDYSQTARDKAAEAEKRFNELFPGIPTYMTYENPNFRVYVGNCLTIEEVIVLEEKVRPAFAGAHRTFTTAPVTVFTE